MNRSLLPTLRAARGGDGRNAAPRLVCADGEGL